MSDARIPHYESTVSSLTNQNVIPVRPADSMTEPNAQVYARVTSDYRQVHLEPAERVLLERVGTQWGSVAMLDLGVGAGRTAYTFAAICRLYIGLDYATAMIDACRSRLGETTRARYVVGDARALPEFADGAFDVALFSFNGIDTIGHDDRQRALREIRRVLAPGGLFLFSSHTLRRFPFVLDRPAWSWRHPVRSLRWHLGAVYRWIRLTNLNRGEDPVVAKVRGWAVLTDEAHNYSLRQYYVSPGEVARQVAAAGFTLEATLDAYGQELDDSAECADLWLHYLCVASGDGAAQ